MNIERSPELEAIVRRMWTSFATGATAAIANIMVDDEASRVILSADDEWFSHSDHLPELLTERAARISIDQVEFDRVEAFQLGNAGWAAQEVTTVLAGGEVLRFRQTLTFVLDEGRWQTVQMHTSRGVPAAETFGYDIAAGLANIVGSLTAQDGEDITAAAGSSGLVTLMFTDVEDSTRLSHERGEADWIRMVQGHFDNVARIVESDGGTVVKTLGDGTMAAFPTTSGAADAAIAIQRTEGEDGFRIRIGIHTGEAVALGSDYAGIAVAKAARVASAASGGEILLSATAKELLTRFDYSTGEDRVAELKGIPGTHRLTPLAY